MKRIRSLIRRHPRLFAGTALIPLAVIVVFGLLSGQAGAAHTNAAKTVALASHPATPAAQPSAARPGKTPPPAHVAFASASRGRTVRTAAHRTASSSPGLRAAPPTSRGVALALKQATGLSPSQVALRPLCPAAGAHAARCAGDALVLRATGAPVHPTGAGGSTTTAPNPGTPAYLQQAYDLSYLSQNGGSGDTVAIVDAYNDPTAASDLSAYRSFYGLPACTTSNGCFREVNENGGTTLPGTTSAGWNQEISLDLDTVSAICPNCHILLVEATTPNSNDMITAMQAAAALGAKQISDSWTITANFVPSGTFTFPGIATVAATGDSGYVGAGVDNYPAALPGVTAAGGTSVSPSSGALTLRGYGEGAWSGGGSGCDLNETKPAFQSDTGCTGRSYADVSADADPQTGLSVYDNGSWVTIGGTSLATPMIAAYYAITGVTNSSSQWAYTDSGALNDIVSGLNDTSGPTCSPGISYICNAATGYDGPTGMGSISGATFTGTPAFGGPPISTGQNTPNTYTQAVSATSASIAGGVYRNGLDTKWWIQYWPNGGSQVSTAAADVGAGSAPVAITGNLSQLTPHTTYNYRLVAQNSLGTTYGYQYSFTTLAASAPSASFVSSPSAPAPGSPMTFDGTSSSGGSGATITDYSWNFGDGTTVDAGTTLTATHTYANRGIYTVSLTVTNSTGQTSTATERITVDTPPTAAFTPSAQVTAPTSVSFNGSATTAASGGSITDYSWNFGDGTTQDSGTSPTGAHTYANPGIYTVTLTTTDDLNVSSTVTQTVLAGSLTAAPTVPEPGAQVTFTAPALTGLTGTVTDYSWNFGDGSTEDTSTTPSATHTYAARGSDTVTLTITTSTTQTLAGSETITVDAPPTADVDPTSAIVAAPGQVVSLSGSTSAASSPGSIAIYTWNFGDGSAPVSASSPSTTHVYGAIGMYTATLTVADDLGVTDSTTKQVIVDEPAAAFTSPATNDVAPNATASFNAAGSSDPEGTIADYSWNFGDGATGDAGSTPTATHAYRQRGHYTVALTVTNGYGQTASTDETVTVDTGPRAAFTPSTRLGTTGTAVGFNAGASAAMSGGSIADYTWNFGDGVTQDNGATASAAHSFSAAGTYTVALTTTDDLGMSSTTTEQLTVQSPAPVTPPPTTTTPAPTPAPTTTTPPPTPSPSPAPSATTQLSASLATVKTQRLAGALAHGLRVTLSLSQGTRASFQVTLPAPRSSAGKRGPNAITLLRTRAQALAAGTHAITLKLSRAAARQLGSGRTVVLTVHVTLTTATGATVSRTVKITLAR